MKKIIIISVLLVALMSLNVFAWGATRVINGNDVTITVDYSEGTDTFTVTETLTGSTTIISSALAGCTISQQSKKLTCDFEDPSKTTITYKTTGTGAVSGKITGGYPSTTKDIIGSSSTIPTLGGNPQGQQPAGAGQYTITVDTLDKKTLFDSILTALNMDDDFSAKISYIAKALKEYFNKAE